MAQGLIRSQFSNTGVNQGGQFSGTWVNQGVNSVTLGSIRSQSSNTVVNQVSIQ